VPHRQKPTKIPIIFVETVPRLQKAKNNVDVEKADDFLQIFPYRMPLSIFSIQPGIFPQISPNSITYHKLQLILCAP
jgi:hypothetical protein